MRRIDVSMMMRRNIESLSIVGEMTSTGNLSLYYHRKKGLNQTQANHRDRTAGMPDTMTAAVRAA
jgi:hypothetical protein